MVAGASQVVKASTRERSVQRYRDVAPLQNLTGPNQAAAEVASVRLCKGATRRTSRQDIDLPPATKSNAADGVTRGADRLTLQAEEHQL